MLSGGHPEKMIWAFWSISEFVSSQLVENRCAAVSCLIKSWLGKPISGSKASVDVSFRNIAPHDDYIFDTTNWGTINQVKAYQNHQIDIKSQYLSKQTLSWCSTISPQFFHPMAPGSVRVSRVQCAVLLCLACPPVVCLGWRQLETSAADIPCSYQKYLSKRLCITGENLNCSSK